MTLIFTDTGPQSNFDWGIHILNDILLQQGTNGATLMDRIFSKAMVRGTAHAEPMDPMMYMLGFNEETLPNVSHHQFSSFMGTFFETLVKNIFRFQRPRLYSDDWKAFCEENDLPQEIGQGKRFGDLRLGDTVIELKYRYASGESKDWQGRAAERLRALGKTPVMLILRPSRNADVMRNAGWDVYEGKEAIAYIEKHANVSLVDIAHACRINPLVQDHTQPHLERYKDCWSATATAMVLSMDEEHKAEHLQTLLAHMPQKVRDQVLETQGEPLTFSSRRKKETSCPSLIFRSSRRSA